MCCCGNTDGHMHGFFTTFAGTAAGPTLVRRLLILRRVSGIVLTRRGHDMTHPTIEVLGVYRVRATDALVRKRRTGGTRMPALFHKAVTVALFDDRFARGGTMTLSDTIAGIAALVSLYSLWQTSLKRSDLILLVAPVIRYASPYQNSNFEAFCIAMTIANAGACTGTVLSLRLTVEDPQNKQTKRFYSASFGEWTVEKAQSGDFRPFAPIVLPGRASYTETIHISCAPRRDRDANRAGDGSFPFYPVA
jgi:hypothetical protein